MAKSVEMSVQAYAKTIGKSRGTVYRYVKDREAGRPSRLPKGITFKTVVGHYVICVDILPKLKPKARGFPASQFVSER